MLSEQLKSNKYRYERKFLVSTLTQRQVESIVKLHPAMFSEIFQQRFVNNIYFDSINLRNYCDNIEGSTHRVKVRVRWYGHLLGSVNKPVLEIKSKNGFLGTKESFLLQPFEIKNGFNVRTISDIINKSDIPEILKMELKSLKPVLLNRYSRKYFQSADRNYRITIDTNLDFYQVNYHQKSLLNTLKNNISVILELKYAADMDYNANQITAFFPFRLSKSSKYVSGIDRLYTW